KVVSCDFTSAFYRRAEDAFTEERGSLGRTGRGAFMQRDAELTPAIPTVLAHPGVNVLTTRSLLSTPDEELHRTAFYREIMTKQGWRHAATLCFWTNPPAPFPILVVSAYRREGRPDFTEKELAQFERLHPFLAVAVLRFHQLATASAA